MAFFFGWNPGPGLKVNAEVQRLAQELLCVGRPPSVGLAGPAWGGFRLDGIQFRLQFRLHRRHLINVA